MPRPSSHRTASPPAAHVPVRQRRAPMTPPQPLSRVAVIDLGSNTARLVVYDLGPGGTHRVVLDLREVPRLGDFLSDDRRLTAPGLTKATAVLEVFARMCRHLRVHRIEAVATSAVRQAANGRRLLTAVRDRTGIRLRTLTGEEEARFGLLGIWGSFDLHRAFVFDLGGGSVQLVQARDGLPHASSSLPLGAVAVSREFLPDGAGSRTHLKKLRRHARRLLADVPWFPPRGLGSVIGIGGTVRTLAKVDMELHDYPIHQVHGYVLRHHRVAEIVQLFAGMHPDKIAEIPGVSADRADILLGGAVVVDELLTALDAPSVTVSAHGIREGVLRQWILSSARQRRRAPWAPPPEVVPGSADQWRHPLRTSLENLSYWHGVDRAHANHVKHLSLSLFDQLRPSHRLGPDERRILAVAADLHDVGASVSYHDHAQHSAYIILTADLGGLSHRDIVRVALTTLLHEGREGPGSWYRSYRGILEKGDREAVDVLGGILAIAEQLECTESRAVQDVRARAARPHRILLTLLPRRDECPELWQARRRRGPLERALGVSIELR